MQISFAVPISGSWATPDNAVELAQRAEQLGYANLWTFQRLLSPLTDDGTPQLEPQYHAVHDPIVWLAYLAAATTRPRLGLAIVNLPYYSPALLAKQLTSLDHVTRGRLDVGLGIGWLPPEMAAAGAPMERRGARADDFLRCLDAIWTDDVVSYDGEFYTVPPSRIDPKPVQRPRPPLLMGGTAPAALQRAGRAADGWISSSRADLTKIAESIEVVRAAAREAGRDADALRFVCRGSVKVRAGERAMLTGSLAEIRGDLDRLAEQGVTETFVDLNFDPEIGSPTADPAQSMARARDVLDALAP